MPNLFSARKRQLKAPSSDDSEGEGDTESPLHMAYVALITAFAGLAVALGVIILSVAVIDDGREVPTSIEDRSTGE